MTDTPKILLVDDEPGMLRYIRTLLEVDNYKVATASTGEEALELVRKGLHPDLVLLDLLMPGIDGLQTMESSPGDSSRSARLHYQAISESRFECHY
jgi:CheY-like chemotaxis protein